MLRFHCKNRYANAPQYYVIPTLPNLFSLPCVVVITALFRKVCCFLSLGNGVGLSRYITWFVSPKRRNIQPLLGASRDLKPSLRHETLDRSQPLFRAAIAQLVQRILRVGRTGDLMSVGGEIIPTRPKQSWGPPRHLYNGYRVSFQGVKRLRRWR